MLANHAKLGDFTGVANEMNGVETGFDHVTEMQNSVVALQKSIDSLQGSLQNPSLGTFSRSSIQQALSRAQVTQNAMNHALAGF